MYKKEKIAKSGKNTTFCLSWKKWIIPELLGKN